MKRVVLSSADVALWLDLCRDELISKNDFINAKRVFQACQVRRHDLEDKLWPREVPLDRTVIT